MMRKFFYIFLILNLITLISVFANDAEKIRLAKNATAVREYAEKIDKEHKLEDSSRELVIKKAESRAGSGEFEEQHKLLLIAARQTADIIDKHEKTCELLNRASEELKKRHPKEIKSEMSISFQINFQMNRGSSGILEPLNNSGISDHLALSERNDNIGCDELGRLRAQNNELHMRTQNLEKQMGMDLNRQMELNKENNGLKRQVIDLEEQIGTNLSRQKALNDENDGLRKNVSDLKKQIEMNLNEQKALSDENDSLRKNVSDCLKNLELLSELYEKIVCIYQNIIVQKKDSRADLLEIRELKKRIEGLKNVKQK